MRHLKKLLVAAGAIVFAAACTSAVTETEANGGTKSVPNETADEFIARLDGELRELYREIGAANWVRATYIIEDTAILAAKAGERGLAFESAAIEASKQYVGQPMSDLTARQMLLLQLGSSMPAPNDPDKRAEISRISTDLEGAYGAGKYCPSGEESCRDLVDLSETMARSRDYDELLEAWKGWRTVSPPMRSQYERFAELMNEGAKELGFANTGELWKSGYDMTPAEFEAETDRLWSQVKPLYEELHCYVRGKLADHYGEDKVPAGEPIPAHLLGNMWSQQWHEIFDLLEPYPGVGNLDINSALEDRGWDAMKMVKAGENFFVSMGLPELPDSFYERSQLTKPQDRDVVCHASAWPLDGGNDPRIKMCIKSTEEELITIHHELGHIYYFLAYKDQPTLLRTGAHDGFHEGIGDAIELSMTPEYLKTVGLIDEVVRNDKALINQQLKMALKKIAFLPFGKLIDQWRWDVFAGNISPGDYNAGWWELRTKYQGIAPPVARSEADFDPGAKYHIPGNTPYTRYFLAHILQFQFHKAMCEAAGFEGPLHECSIYNNKAAGKGLEDMMAMGASQPWPDALEALTGTRDMDASAIIDYFQPLMAWLAEENEGQTCGW